MDNFRKQVTFNGTEEQIKKNPAIKALMEAAGNGDGRFLRFAPLTLVPLDPALIDPAYLTPQTREVLNRYHSRVYVEIAPLLTEEERNWLRLQTRPV